MVLHKIWYMIFKILYWTYSGIVFDKCHQKVTLTTLEKRKPITIFFLFPYFFLPLKRQVPSFDPLPDHKILDRSKLKQSADGNFTFHESSRKFSKRIENTVGKGEIAHYEQFLLFPQCFQILVSQGVKKVSLCGNGLICCLHLLTTKWTRLPINTQCRILTH